MPTMPAGPMPPVEFLPEPATKVNPDQRVAPGAEPVPDEPFGDDTTEANVLAAMRLLDANDASKMTVIKYAYMAEWDAFDRAWRRFLTDHSESHPTVGRVRAAISLLS